MGTISRMGSKRKADLKFLDFVASEFSGNNVYVYESCVQNGKRVYKDANGFVKEAPNGMYMANGDIYIDLNAGMEGEGFVLNTFAHELTHHIRDWSPTKFKALADFLVKEYGKAGQSVDELVHARMAKSDLDYDAAFEEVVADSMEKMFADGNIMDKLTKLKAQDKGLLQRIKNFIDKWLSKIKEFYSAEGQYITREGELAHQFERFEQLQQLFAEALVDAGENYQMAEKSSADGNSANKEPAGRNHKNESNEETVLDNGQNSRYSKRKNNQFFPGNVFPPYNTSHSDSHEVAERWARSEEGRTEKQRLLSHHSEWYVIQVVYDMDYGYQIVRKLSDAEYKREAKFYGTIARHQSVSDIARRNVTRHRGRNRNDGAGYRADSNKPEHGGKNISVFGMDIDNDGGRKVESNEVRDHRGGSEYRGRRYEPSENTIRLDELSARGKWLESQLKKDRISSEKKKEYRRELKGIRAEMRERIKGYFPSRDEKIRKSDRTGESISNRSLLANAFESMAQNDIEKQKIAEYKTKIETKKAEDRKLRDLKEQIKEMSFAKGPRDTAKLRSLREEAIKTANCLCIDCCTKKRQDIDLERPYLFCIHSQRNDCA